MSTRISSSEWPLPLVGTAPGMPVGASDAVPAGVIGSTDDIRHRRHRSLLVRLPAGRFLGRLQPAARSPLRATDLDEPGLFFTARPLEWTARLELAADGHAERIGYDALDCRQLLAALLLARNGAQQTLRVGMLGRQQHVVDLAGLDDPAGVHHRDVLDRLGDDRQV